MFRRAYDDSVLPSLISELIQFAMPLRIFHGEQRGSPESSMLLYEILSFFTHLPFLESDNCDCSLEDGYTVARIHVIVHEDIGRSH